MSESKLKSNPAAVEPGSKETVSGSVKKYRGRTPVILGIVIILAVLLAIVGWSLYKNRHQNKHIDPNVGLTQAIAATQNNTPISSYTSFEEASSAGDLYAAHQQEAQAYAAYQRALQLTAKPPVDLYITLGQTATTLKKTAAAKSYYQKALKAYDFNTLDSPDRRQLQQEADK